MKRVCCLFAVLFLAGIFSSCGAQAGEKDLLGRKVYYAGTSKELTSSTYSLLNMDDICMTTLVYENETERIKVDSEGRLKGYRDLTVDIPDEVTASKTDEEITKIVEAYMAEKLPMEQCKVSQITLTFLGYQVMLHSENADISASGKTVFTPRDTASAASDPLTEPLNESIAITIFFIWFPICNSVCAPDRLRSEAHTIKLRRQHAKA